MTYEISCLVWCWKEGFVAGTMLGFIKPTASKMIME